MILRIYDHITVADIQERFNSCFPHLKMEFYTQPHNWQQQSAAKYHIKPDRLIGNIRRKHTPGVLEIKSWYKTGKVEQDMRELFGLNIQIFRIYRDRWIQTSYSDELTLEQQELLAE